jgi:hypothetical protein
MLSRPKPSNQLGFYSRLEDQLDRNHPLYLLTNKINWTFFDQSFGYKFMPQNQSIFKRLETLKRTKGGDVKARKASKKIKTIAGRLVRDIERKLPAKSLMRYSSDLELFKRILSQKRSDSNKIYSLHEPQVKCYTKGKEHKKFEFGSKVSLLITQKTGVI